LNRVLVDLGLVSQKRVRGSSRSDYFRLLGLVRWFDLLGTVLGLLHRLSEIPGLSTGCLSVGVGRRFSLQRDRSGLLFLFDVFLLRLWVENRHDGLSLG